MIEILAHAESGSWFPLVWPPAHPLLVNFTAALLPISFLAELAGRWLRKPSLSATGYWTLLAAAAVTPFTALAGWLWKRQMEGMSMAPMPVHQWLGTALAAILILLAIWRVRIGRRQQLPGAAYLLSMTLLILALMLQGHLGATMSFAPAESEASEPSEPQHDAAAPTEGQQKADHDSAAPTTPRAAPATVPATTQPATTQAAAVYTCTMHPDVISDKPGACPKCGMKLVLRK